MSQMARPVRSGEPISERSGALPAEPARERPPYLLALAAAAAVFALYAITLSRTTWFWDTSEYIATAHIMGIPHPPGNPLFVLLARAWELLLSWVPIPTPMKINTFSAAMSAGTAFFWYLTVHRVLQAFTDRPLFRRVGAGVAVAVSATAYTVWNQSNVNEKVYTVSMFTIALLTWLVFLWRDHVEAHRGIRGKRFHDDNVLLLVVYVLALSVGNHLMAFLAAPALALFVLLVKPRVVLNWRIYPLAVVVGILGLSVHMYLPLRSGLDPIINQAAPACPSVGSALHAIVTFGEKIPLPGPTCEDLRASLAREQYAKPPLSERQAPLGVQLLNYFQYFDWQWARSVGGTDGYFAPGRLLITLLFAGIGIFGAVEHWRRDRKSFLYLGTLFFTLSFALTYYMNFKYGFMQVQQMGLDPNLSEVRERDYFFLVSFSLWGLWVGVGLTALWLRIAEEGGWARKAVGAGSLVYAVALVPLVLNWPYANRANDYAARDLAYNMLNSVEPYGVLFTNGDNDTFPLWYLQEVEGIRRDVTVIVLSYLNTPWYTRQLRDLSRPCERPGQAAEEPTRIVCQRPFVAPTPELARLYGTPRPPTRAILPLTDAEIERIAGPPGYTQLPDDVVFEARGIEVGLPRGQVLMAADLFLLQIVQSAWGDRPIYFAATTNAMFELRFEDHIERQGLAFKLVAPEDRAGLVALPTGQFYSPTMGAFMSPARNRVLLDSVFQYRGMPDRAVWPDDATRNIPMHYAYALEAQGALVRAQGDTAAAAAYDRRGQAFRDLASGRRDR